MTETTQTLKNRAAREERRKSRIMQDQTLRRKCKALIKHACAQGATMQEAADYGGVCIATMYKWFKEDPAWKEECDRVKSQPVFKARETVVKNLDKPKTAQWYLERKKPDEFSPTVVKEIKGEVTVKHELEELSTEELMKIAYKDAIDVEVIDARPRISSEPTGGESQEGTGEESSGEKKP